MKSIQGTQVERGASKEMTWGVRVGGEQKDTSVLWTVRVSHRTINYFLENKK